MTNRAQPPAVTAPAQSQPAPIREAAQTVTVRVIPIVLNMPLGDADIYLTELAPELCTKPRDEHTADCLNLMGYVRHAEVTVRVLTFQPGDGVVVDERFGKITPPIDPNDSFHFVIDAIEGDRVRLHRPWKQPKVRHYAPAGTLRHAGHNCADTPH